MSSTARLASSIAPTSIPDPTQQAPPDNSANSPFPAGPDKKTNFGDLLDSHLESTEDRKDDTPPCVKRKEEKQPDPWSVLGAASTGPVLPNLPPKLEGGTAQNDTNSASCTASDAAGEILAAPPQVQTEHAKTTPNDLRGNDGNDLQEKTLVSALKQQILPSASAEPKIPEQIAGESDNPAEKSRGITAAKHAAMLLTKAISTEDENTASRSEQKHPLVLDRFEISKFEQRIQSSKDLFTNPLAKSEDRENSDSRQLRVERIDFGSLNLLSSESKNTDAPVAPELKPATPVDTTATIEAIRSHVQVLRGNNQERLDVVLRPDRDTQLSLHITKVDGQIQVQARCERGDFALLESHWGAIQNSLSSQGIRVEPLQASASTGQHSNWNPGGQHNGFSPRHDQPADREPLEREFATSASSGRSARARSARKAAGAKPELAGVRVSRGWQSWA
jgi:hypothetical protein